MTEFDAKPACLAEKHKPVIGLIGGIGSGKSRIAEEMARHGGRIISGDRLGHETLRIPEVRQEVFRRWGAGVRDDTGEIDRKKLGALVFADPVQRKMLETLVFPRIEQRIQEEIASADMQAEVSFAVLDAAVMLEAGWSKVCDRLVYVDVPPELRLRRLEGQRGWTTGELHSRENAQMPLDEKARWAMETIDNGGPWEKTVGQVTELLRKWNVTPGK